jgi:O6-methylguanine-DNA--protein-cysteine methyltransferase
MPCYTLGTSWRGAVISYSIFQHVLVGDLILVAKEDRLIRSSYVDSKLAPSVGVDWVREPKHAMLAEAVAQLKEYLGAKRSTLTIPLQIQGTEFQRKVYNLVRQIPIGTVASVHGYCSQAGHASRRSLRRRGDRQKSAVDLRP